MPKRLRPAVGANVLHEIERVVQWYLETAYGRWEGPGTKPFFADLSRIGHFAVDLDALTARDEGATFRLLVTLASYQSRRDIDIMQMQRTMKPRVVSAMTSPVRLKVLTTSGNCSHLSDAATFDRYCDVRRDLLGGTATCSTHPRTPCHVKNATMAIGRMGDFGKLPTSAWLHLRDGGFARWLEEVTTTHHDPRARARAMVERTAEIFRIGVKLATMFVTALSVPELTGFAPWSPNIDGSRLLVIDGNVARAIQLWRRGPLWTNYERNARWLLARAKLIQLSRFHPSLPPCSPRLVQQAIYLFRSFSNRKAHRDRCAAKPCASCPSRICPYKA